MKNILLTGSGGFIGGHLKAVLSKDNRLFVPRSRELNLLDAASVRDYLRANQIDFIVHSAAAGVRISPEDTLEAVCRPNVEMFDNLARAAIPMITVGSGAEYDKSVPLVRVKEDDFGKSVPKDAYGYSKYLISKEIEKRDHILNLRLFGIYGEGEHPSRVTSCIINACLRREPVELNQNVRFHFIYIEDFCEIVRRFTERFPKEKFVNVAPTRSVEIAELAAMVNSFSGYKSEIVIKQPGLNREYTADNARLLSLLDGFAFTDYEEGMKKFYLTLKERMHGG